MSLSKSITLYSALLGFGFLIGSLWSSYTGAGPRAVNPELHVKSNNSNVLSSKSTVNSHNSRTKELQKKGKSQDILYQPSIIENYVMEHAIDLGFDEKPVNRSSKSVSCNFIVRNEDPSMNETMVLYRSALQRYKEQVTDITSTPTGVKLPIPDIRKLLRDNNRDSNEEVCQSLGFTPNQLGDIFGFDEKEQEKNYSNVLSYNNRNGYIEPLLPPLRHPNFCESRNLLMSLDYLVHDFYTMCMNLKPHSRIILVDMGASLTFHGERTDSPAIFLMALYTRFGFKFDHIYAYEMRQQDPLEVFDKVPDEFKPAYHWINVGVNSHPDSSLNPLRMILQKYDEDDLVIVKLDIDTPSVELPLATQIVNNAAQFGKLIDHFYFEHHVFLQELMGNWGNQVSGSVYDSLKLFQQIRKMASLRTIGYN